MYITQKHTANSFLRYRHSHSQWRNSCLLCNLKFSVCCRLRLKCDGTCAENRFYLSAKRTSSFKSAGASVQSTTGSRGARISSSNAGYTMFQGIVKGIGYPLHLPVSLSLPLPCVTMCHHVSTALYMLHALIPLDLINVTISDAYCRLWGSTSFAFKQHFCRYPYAKVSSSSKGIGKAIPLQDWRGPEGSRRPRLPDFKTIGTWRW